MSGKWLLFVGAEQYLPQRRRAPPPADLPGKEGATSKYARLRDLLCGEITKLHTRTGGIQRHTAWCGQAIFQLRNESGVHRHHFMQGLGMDDARPRRRIVHRRASSMVVRSNQR